MHELRDGFRYAFGFIPIRILLLLVSTVSLTSTALWVLLPVFTKDVLGGDSVTFSIMTAAIGLGALGGALSLASRKSVLGLGRIIAWAGGAFVIGLLGVSMSKSIWVAIPFLVVTGFAMMVQTTASNTILQTIVDDEKRGRVMSFYAMAFLGTAPLGGIMAGSVAHWLGVVGTIQAAAAICLLGTATFAWKLPALREIIRPIYRRIGIIPVGTELASGIPSATAEWAITSERNGGDLTRSG
jgi:MFS family permease